MNKPSNIRKEIEFVQKRIEELRRNLDFLRANIEFFEANGLHVQEFQGGIDINDPSREQVLAVICHFPGSWDRTRSGRRNFNYTLRDSNPPLCLYSAEPPPSYKTVIKTRIIPAEPERKEEYVEIVCENLSKDDEPACVTEL